MSRVKLITPDQLKTLYPKVYKVFFSTPGYDKFMQMKLILKEKANNKR